MTKLLPLLSMATAIYALPALAFSMSHLPSTLRKGVWSQPMQRAVEHSNSQLGLRAVLVGEHLAYSMGLRVLKSRDIGGLSRTRWVRAICGGARRNTKLARSGAISSADEQQAPQNDIYEKALLEFESEKLYGQTPKLYELDSLANMYKKGRLNLAPKYQRGYVWKPERASRLVVTALCNRLVPGIVLHEFGKGKFEVVDGKQRLTTLLAFFLAGEDPPMFDQLKAQVPGITNTLTKLDENYDDLNGLTFEQLTTDRKYALASYTIPCTIVPYLTPKAEVFSCYEDINSGGEDLNSQQLRRAVYYGPYIQLLDALVKVEDFQAIRDPKKFRAGGYELDPKESDRELILRAFAFNRNWRQYKRPMKKFLNAELEAVDAMDEKKQEEFLARAKEEFLWVMKVWRAVFSDGAFRAWSANKDGVWGWSNAVSTPLWDVLYGVIAELRISHPNHKVYQEHADKIQRRMKDLFASNDLDLAGAVTIQRLADRRGILARALKEALPTPPSSAGSDPRAIANRERLVPQLFAQQEGRCSICGQPMDEGRLADGAYVHVDHVQPVAKGGASSQDNLALAHSVCNQSKGAREDKASGS